VRSSDTPSRGSLLAALVTVRGRRCSVRTCRPIFSATCGLVERDIDNARLAGNGEGGPLDDLLGHSITDRIAVGPRAGQKLFTLQTVPARSPQWLVDANGAARAGGAGSTAEDALDALPRGVRPAQQAADLGQISWAGRTSGRAAGRRTGGFQPGGGQHGSDIRPVRRSRLCGKGGLHFLSADTAQKS
jgi:hypothetical protein